MPINRVLTLPMKGIYFDQIKSGEKLEEYRLCTDYWNLRLMGRVFHWIALTRGYPKGGGIEGETRLTLPWPGYPRVTTITHPHFGPDPVKVFAIDVSTAAPDPAPLPSSARGGALGQPQDERP